MTGINLTKTQLCEAESCQKIIYELLRIYFEEKTEVRIEWDTSKDGNNGLSKNGMWPPYCPRPDLAVGHFNLSENESEILKKRKEILDLAKDSVKLLDKLSSVTFQNSESSTNYRFHELREAIIGQEEIPDGFNKNPRCFMSIEIESSSHSKYLLGDITNACALGLVGIVVPTNSKSLKKFIELRRYLEFATFVKKMPKIFNNLIIIPAEDFSRVLSRT